MCDAESDPLHLADGVHHHHPRCHGLAVLLPAGLVRLTAHTLSSRVSPYNGITCAQNICDVRVEGIWVVILSMKERARKEEGGGNGFDEHAI